MSFRSHANFRLIISITYQLQGSDGCIVWCSCCSANCINHYDDVIMTTLASQITSLTVVYSIAYSGVDQRKHQSSASLAFVRGIHRDRWIPRTKGQQRGKCFHLMTSSWIKMVIDAFYKLLMSWWKCKNIFHPIIIFMIQKSHNLVHVTTAGLSWQGQNCDLIVSLSDMTEQPEFLHKIQIINSPAVCEMSPRLHDYNSIVQNAGI